MFLNLTIHLTFAEFSKKRQAQHQKNMPKLSIIISKRICHTDLFVPKFPLLIQKENRHPLFGTFIVQIRVSVYIYPTLMIFVLLS